MTRATDASEGSSSVRPLFLRLTSIYPPTFHFNTMPIKKRVKSEIDDFIVNDVRQ